MEQSKIARIHENGTFSIHGEQGILKTVQCTVLPCEVSEGIWKPDAVTEAAALLTAAENARSGYAASTNRAIKFYARSTVLRQRAQT